MERLGIKIRWDGDVPGLANHELSIAAFGAALPSMLRAVRRIAQSSMKEAKRRGRYTKQVEMIDLRLSKLEPGCVTMNISPVLDVPAGANFELLSDDLLERSCVKFVEAVGREAEGRATEENVRRFLTSLPFGLNAQRYAVTRGDKEISVAEIRVPRLVDLGRAPAMRMFVGSIAGVGFQPWNIKVRTSRRAVVLSATEPQVNRALELREKEVRALAAFNAGGDARLVWLRDAGQVDGRSSSAEIREEIFRDWSHTLQRLGSE